MFPRDERGLNLANEGKIDGNAYQVLNLRKITGNRYPNLIRVNEPYVRIYLSAFVTDKKMKINDWNDLAPYRIAVLRDGKTGELRTKEFVAAEKQTPVTDPDQAFDMLSQGKIDAVVTDEIKGRFFMGNRRHIYIRGRFEPSDIYLYLNKKHRDLVPKIEKQVRQMRQDGTLDEIEKTVRKKILESS